MKESEVMTFISERFDANWSHTLYETDNTNIVKDSLSEWVRLSIKPVSPERLGFKSTTRRMGIVYVQVFTEEMIGSGRAIQLAELAGDIFGLIRKGDLVFDPYDITIVGDSSSLNTLSEKISWFQVNCAIPYSFLDSSTTLVEL